MGASRWNGVMAPGPQPPAPSPKPGRRGVAVHVRRRSFVDFELPPTLAERAQALLRSRSTCQSCGRSVGRNRIRVFVVRRQATRTESNEPWMVLCVRCRARVSESGPQTKPQRRARHQVIGRPGRRGLGGPRLLGVRMPVPRFDPGPAGALPRRSARRTPLIPVPSLALALPFTHRYRLCRSSQLQREPVSGCLSPSGEFARP